MTHLAPLRSERLLIRAPVPADAERIARFHAENRARLAPFEPTRPEAWYTPEFWREEIPRLTVAAAAGQGAWFLLSRREDSEGSLVGRCAITNIVRGAFQAGYLGFALAAPAQGRGLMSEALAEIVRFAFGELGLHRLMANYRPENERSARLLARLDFRIEGLAKDYLRLDGAWRDHVLTARVHPGVGDRLLE